LTADAEVLAAGAIVARAREDGGPEILLVHRNRYDDWSFPKGKLDPGESFEDAARREVWEETGVRIELERELPPIRYDDHKGRSKLVRYWRARVGAYESPDSIVDPDEIDAQLWCAPADAHELLTYAHDRTLLEHFTAAPG
jgi:8-oxo-dGTP pyrophosphatase MutT (NUDIX family)